MKYLLHASNLRVELLGFLVLLGASACGSSSVSGSSAPSSATVLIPHADRFEPFVAQIASGGTVTFKNQDTDAHTVVAMPTDPEDFQLLVSPGKAVTHTFKSRRGVRLLL